MNFVGEGAIDAGGPYRESLSDMTKELWMPHLALFVPCSNRRAELEGFVDGMAGIHNMDKFVPNPVRRSPYHLELYAFVGKLLGLAMRASLALPFHLPGLVFKRVLGQAVTKVDLKLVDKFLVDYLDNVSNAHLDPNMTAELFGDLYGDRSFTTKTIDGREVELVPGGDGSSSPSATAAASSSGCSPTTAPSSTRSAPPSLAGSPPSCPSTSCACSRRSSASCWSWATVRWTSRSCGERRPTTRPTATTTRPSSCSGP